MCRIVKYGTEQSRFREVNNSGNVRVSWKIIAKFNSSSDERLQLIEGGVRQKANE